MSTNAQAPHKFERIGRLDIGPRLVEGTRVHLIEFSGKHLVAAVTNDRPLITKHQGPFFRLSVESETTEAAHAELPLGDNPVEFHWGGSRSGTYMCLDHLEVGEFACFSSFAMGRPPIDYVTDKIVAIAMELPVAS